MSSEFKISPLRSIEDFLLSQARFEKPRWSNRIIANLLYYQTNYFVIAAFIFLVSGVLSPQKMLFALIVTSIGVMAAIYSSRSLYTRSKDQPQALNYQTLLSLAIILVSAYLLLYNYSSIAILISSIFFSITIILIHASMRLRGWKNKINNKFEMVGFRKTPMGLLLNAIHVLRSDDVLN